MKQFHPINSFFNPLLRHSIISIFSVLKFNRFHKQVFLAPKKVRSGSVDFGNIEKIVITIYLLFIKFIKSCPLFPTAVWTSKLSKKLSKKFRCHFNGGNSKEN